MAQTLRQPTGAYPSSSPIPLPPLPSPQPYSHEYDHSRTPSFDMHKILPLSPLQSPCVTGLADTLSATPFRPSAAAGGASADEMIEKCLVEDPIKLGGQYVYPIKVSRKSGETGHVWRRWEEFVAFNDRLMASAASLASAHASSLSPRPLRRRSSVSSSLIPRLPRSYALWATRQVLHGRRDELNLFVRRLLELPEDVISHDVLDEFFSSWPRDIANQKKPLPDLKSLISIPFDANLGLGLGLGLDTAPAYGAYGRPAVLTQKRSTPDLRQMALQQQRENSLSPLRPTLPPRADTFLATPAKTSMEERYHSVLRGTSPSPPRKPSRHAVVAASEDEPYARGVSPLSFCTIDSQSTIKPSRHQRLPSSQRDVFFPEQESASIPDTDVVVQPVKKLKGFRSLQNIRKAAAATPAWGDIPVPPVPLAVAMAGKKKLGKSLMARSRSGSISAPVTAPTTPPEMPGPIEPPPTTPTRSLFSRASLSDLRARKNSAAKSVSSRPVYKRHSPANSISSLTSSFDSHSLTTSSTPSLVDSASSRNSGRLSSESFSDCSFSSPFRNELVQAPLESPATPFSDIQPSLKYNVDPVTGQLTCNNTVPLPPSFPLPPSMTLPRRNRRPHSRSSEVSLTFQAVAEAEELCCSEPAIVVRPSNTFALKVRHSTCNVMMRLSRDITLAEALYKAATKIVLSSRGEAGIGPWRFDRYSTEEEWSSALHDCGERITVQLL